MKTSAVIDRELQVRILRLGGKKVGVSLLNQIGYKKPFDKNDDGTINMKGIVIGYIVITHHNEGMLIWQDPKNNLHHYPISSITEQIKNNKQIDIDSVVKPKNSDFEGFVNRLLTVVIEIKVKHKIDITFDSELFKQAPQQPKYIAERSNLKNLSVQQMLEMFNKDIESKRTFEKSTREWVKTNKLEIIKNLKLIADQLIVANEKIQSIQDMYIAIQNDWESAGQIFV